MQVFLLIAHEIRHNHHSNEVICRTVTITKIGADSNFTEVKGYMSIYTNSILCCYLTHPSELYDKYNSCV